MSCPECGKDTKKKFCSVTCSNRFNAKQTFISSKRNIELIEEHKRLKQTGSSKRAKRLSEMFGVSLQRVYIIIDSAKKYGLLD